MNQTDECCKRYVKRKFRGQMVLVLMNKRSNLKGPEYERHEEACRWLRTLFPEIITPEYVTNLILEHYNKTNDQMFQLYLDTLSVEEREDFVKDYLQEFLRQKENDKNGN